MQIYQKLTKGVDKLLYFGIGITFSVLIASCVLQVFTRTVLNDSLSWTEELARYAFIWSNFLGAAVCTKRGTHATVTAMIEAIPENARKALHLVVMAVIILIAIVLIRYGFKVAFAVRSQLSPALRVSMGLIYAAAPVSGLFILWYAAYDFINAIRMIGRREMV